MDFSFGPVPSRRLGRSLGINNVVPKTCTYSCIYCQLGKTLNFTSKRERFYDPDGLVASVRERVNELRSRGIRIDYLTFVPDGEPTLDTNLGKEIELLKDLGIRIAVITNSSLIWDENVKDALINADWVSFKIDSVNEKVWKKINVPFRDLDLEKILNGIIDFSKNFHGILNTETMLVKGVNDFDIEETAKFIGEINPEKAYISVPTRPPALEWVKIPDEKTILNAYNIFRKYIKNVETLTDFEGDDFTTLGNTLNDIMGIISVHPIREDALKKILEGRNIPWENIENLVSKGLIKKENYMGNNYYIKKLKI